MAARGLVGVVASAMPQSPPVRERVAAWPPAAPAQRPLEFLLLQALEVAAESELPDEPSLEKEHAANIFEIFEKVKIGHGAQALIKENFENEEDLESFENVEEEQAEKDHGNFENAGDPGPATKEDFENFEKVMKEHFRMQKEEAAGFDTSEQLLSCHAVDPELVPEMVREVPVQVCTAAVKTVLDWRFVEEMTQRTTHYHALDRAYQEAKVAIQALEAQVKLLSNTVQLYEASAQASKDTSAASLVEKQCRKAFAKAKTKASKARQKCLELGVDPDSEGAGTEKASKY